MSEHTQAPATADTTIQRHDSTLPDVIESNTDPLLSVQTPLGGFELPSAHDLLHGGFDAACKLFESDSHKYKGTTFQSLIDELATFEEGNPDTGPLDVTHSFITEDPSVPARVKFGPASPMTQQLMADSGVAGAREAFYLDGNDWTSAKFRLDDFVRETLEIATEPTEKPLTEHMVGSYVVKVVETPGGELMFAVFNNTGAASATRNPFTQKSVLDDREREAPGGFGTVYQVYYWTEPLRPGTQKRESYLPPNPYTPAPPPPQSYVPSEPRESYIPKP
jgi:hypothetical protein